MREPSPVFIDPRARDANYTVLLVDDEPDILDSIQRYLQATLPDVEVRTAKSGMDGLDVLAKGGIDLIVTDYRMPGMDGIEFLERAKASRPNVPRIMLTAYPDLSTATTAINEEGIQKYLTKPVDPKKLAAIVKQALEHARAEQMREDVVAGERPRHAL